MWRSLNWVNGASSRPPPSDLTLVELFLADANANAAILVQGSEELAKGATDPTILLPVLEMAAQSIKGAASIIDFAPARLLAEELQASFQRLENGSLSLTRQVSAALLCAAEELSVMAGWPADELFLNANKRAEPLRSALEGLRARPTPGTVAPRASAPPAPRLPPSSRPRLLSAPPNVDAAILGLFYAETESCAATLSRGLVQLEPGDTAGLEELMRAAHSIKGAARIVGFGIATRLAHAMEECFVAAQAQRLVLGGNHVDLLLEAVDVLGDMARRPDLGLARWQAEQGPLAHSLVERLEKAAAGEPVPDRVRTPKIGAVPVPNAEQASSAEARAGAPAGSLMITRVEQAFAPSIRAHLRYSGGLRLGADLKRRTRVVSSWQCAPPYL